MSRLWQTGNKSQTLYNSLQFSRDTLYAWKCLLGERASAERLRQTTLCATWLQFDQDAAGGIQKSLKDSLRPFPEFAVLETTPKMSPAALSRRVEVPHLNGRVRVSAESDLLGITGKSDAGHQLRTLRVERRREEVGRV